MAIAQASSFVPAESPAVAKPGPPIAVEALERACGHVRHVGCCPDCQRAQLARWDTQLEQVGRRTG
jgi:hypothetical protein